MIVSQLTGQRNYLIFTIAVGIIAFFSCGLTYFFPFRESKSNNSFHKTSQIDQSHYLPLNDQGKPNQKKNFDNSVVVSMNSAAAS